MTNQKPPIDLEPIASAAVQIAWLAFVGFLTWLELR